MIYLIGRYDIIVACPLSLLTMQSLLESSRRFMFFTEQLVQESLVGPGKKPLLVLTAKTHAPNGGTDIVVRRMLSSMSSEELSTSPTFCDGSTVIRSVWSARDQRSPWPHVPSGLLRTWLQETGILS